MSVKTRAQHKLSLIRRKAMRSRVKKSHCRKPHLKKSGRACNKTKGCKFVNTLKRKYCRKSKNKKFRLTKKHHKKH